MNTLFERLLEICRDKGIDSPIGADIQRIAGISSGRVTQIKNEGEAARLSDENVRRLTRLGYSGDWIQDGRLPKFSNKKDKNYPSVIGTAKCGDKGYYLDLDGGDGFIEFEASPGSIAIRIRGDSMYPAIRDGWFVVIEPGGRPTIGEYVLLKFRDGKKMVKELLQIKEDSFIVMSVNDGGRITAMKDDLEGIEAISAVVPPSKHKEWI